MSITSNEKDLIASLSYDPLTGLITWKEGTRRAGKEAGCSTKRGHRLINRNSTVYLAHRVAWLLHHGVWPSEGLDHVDGNPANNRMSNLREASQSINNKNRKLNSNSKSGVSGVAWCSISKKWRAYINVDHKQTTLGRFDSFDEAVAVRKTAEANNNYHPNHGRA